MTSVIIANHNYASFLAEAIESALGQDEATTEVIVVDDGSTDESVDIVRRYGRRVTLIEQAHRGQAAAWNTGFEHSRGDIVVFLDADDRLHPGLVSAARRCLDDHPGAARVHYPLRCIDQAGRPTGNDIPADLRSLPSGDLRPRVLVQPDDIAWQPTTGNAFRANVLARVMPIPEPPYRISADHYTSNLTALLGSVAVYPEPGADYRIHGSNADYRPRVDIERTRQNVVRTISTHCELSRLAAEEGIGAFPADPLSVLSTSFIASRLASLKVAPDLHPVPTDRVARLCRMGIRAALLRKDLPLRQRVAWASWFVVTAAAPRGAVERLASAALRR